MAQRRHQWAACLIGENNLDCAEREKRILRKDFAAQGLLRLVAAEDQLKQDAERDQPQCRDAAADRELGRSGDHAA